VQHPALVVAHCVVTTPLAPSLDLEEQLLEQRQRHVEDLRVVVSGHHSIYLPHSILCHALLAANSPAFCHVPPSTKHKSFELKRCTPCSDAYKITYKTSQNRLAISGNFVDLGRGPAQVSRTSTPPYVDTSMAM
jgi:hypothetical protein